MFSNPENGQLVIFVVKNVVEKLHTIIIDKLTALADITLFFLFFFNYTKTLVLIY